MLKQFFLLLLLFSFLNAKTEINIFAVLTDGLNFVNSKDAKIAIKLWLKNLAGEEQQNRFDLVYLKKREKVLKDFQEGKIAYLSINSIYYLKYRQLLNENIKEIYTFLITNDQYVRYLLVTNKNIKDLKNLKYKTLGIQKSEYIEELYINHLLLENNLSSHNNFFKKTHEYESHSRTLMKLFFNKIDACIVPEHIWNLMTEMNPQINKKLKIIDQSKKIFIPAISLISTKMDDDIYKLHKNNAQEIMNTTNGKQILTLLKATSYQKVNKDLLQPMIDYYQEYLTLQKKKYGK
jgi:phosphonate transport system substrate-binding protein